MGLQKHSEFIILSWDELSNYINIIVEKLNYTQHGIKVNIRPISNRALIPAAMLAERLGTQVVFDCNAQNVTFDLFDDTPAQVVLFSKEMVEFEHQSIKADVYADQIFRNQNGDHQKVIFPWKPL